MGKSKLVPGFRFHPTNVELIQYYLKRKVMGKKYVDDVIAEVDIYKYAPWDLPDKCCLRTGDLEWYFFCPRGKKSGSGARMNRATEDGYWKVTGRDRAIQHNNQTVGMIKTLVFHKGKAPRGDRTDWVMHEYRLENKNLKGIPQDSYVICKVFQKEGRGPRNGAQYGRPFNEEDWDDEEVEIPLAASSVPNDNRLPAIECIGSTSVAGLPGSIHFPAPANPSDPSDQAANSDDDILGMLDFSTEDNPSLEENIAQGAPSSGFVEGFGDPSNWAALGGFSSSQNAESSTNEMVTSGDVMGFSDLEFVELIDLDSPNFMADY